MWVVVGLGNPGLKYSQTRHNAGFIFVKDRAKDWKVKLRQRGLLFKSGVLKKLDESILFVLPLTYMNRSGIAVREVIGERRASTDKLVVVYDDLDIPLGCIRVRREGSPGTHRGARSIVQELETTKFSRIRLGIGPLPPEEDATRFVLSSFDREERVLFDKSLEKAKEALEMILAGEIDKAMNIYNTMKET